MGKQEIITGMEDGSLDSPYCSSTGAGTYLQFIYHHFFLYLILLLSITGTGSVAEPAGAGTLCLEPEPY